VKVIWTREDDLLYDKFRPASHNRPRGGVDAQGRIVAWEHRIAGASIRGHKQRGLVEGETDSSSVEGTKNIPYAIANLFVSYAMYNPGIPVGYWRSVGRSQNAYITECFFDAMPEVDVHVLPSRESPGGVGEPGVPPAAPAVANAVFALTGRPACSIPIRLT
jgi:CO/xanthine dehydrogenase Mo-binding subunit